MSNWIALRAGPLSMAFDPAWATLRRIRLGDREVLRAIYAPVRDRNWDTVPPAVSNLQVERGDDSFRITFDAECKRHEVDFLWQGAVAGAADGTVAFTMKGVARSAFLRQRIGFCVLHPVAECAGQPCTIVRPDGTALHGRFPRHISPHQPFRDIRAVIHEVVPGLKARVLCEGDVFEMEDQRNWSDGSFKTYCTPLDLPRPVEVAAGAAIEQSVTLTLEGVASARKAGPLVLTLGDRPTGQLPRLGLAAAGHAQPLSLRERARLKALNLSHLRVDLRLSERGWRQALIRAVDEAEAIGATLEAALLFSDAADEELRLLREEVDRYQPRIASWLLFPAAGGAAALPALADLARRRLATEDRSVKFGGGTLGNFTELNRDRPSVEALDLVCYSVNPQVHTFDDASMAESLEGQAWTVRSAKQFIGPLQLAVTPVTLKPRAGRRPSEPGELPPNVDPRQASLFCAAWTLGSLAALAEAGLDSATCFETTGWLGVMETEQGSPLPERFPSTPGAVFPVWHVFADAGEFAGAEVIPMASSDRLAAVGLALRKRGKTRVLLANLTDEPQQVAVRGVRGFLTLHSLDEGCLAQATRAPEAFRARAGRILNASGAEFTLDLPPYGLVRADGGR